MTTEWLDGATVRDLSGFVTQGDFDGGLYGVCLHVNESEDGTGIDFWGPGNPGDVTPNFQVWKDGHVDQLLPFGQRPWCQVDGNQHYAAIETAGLHSEPLTDAQVAAVARIMAVYHVEYGVPLFAVDMPGQRGLILHSDGGAAWGGHPCPGTIRAFQRAAILTAATALTQGGLTMDKEVQAAFDALNAKVDAQTAKLETFDYWGDKDRPDGLGDLGAKLDAVLAKLDTPPTPPPV